MISDDEDTRMEAYRKAERASDLLDEAAEDLGFEDVHALGNAAREDDLDRQTDDGVKAITNAHSYLNNGQLEGLVEAVR